MFEFMIYVLVVFAITLTLTKSDIFACKRKFIIDRYEYSKKNGRPCFFHLWFYKMATCEMCSGFWISLFLSPFLSPCNFIVGTLAAYGANWLLHCVENCLYQWGELSRERLKSQPSTDSSKTSGTDNTKNG
jgi:hypothetical protein